MKSLFRHASLEEILFAPRQEHPSAPASDFRHRFARYAVFNGDTPCLPLQVHGAAGKVQKIRASHPAVAGIVHPHPVPAMVLILRVPVVVLRGERHVLHTTFRYLPLIIRGDDHSPSVFLVYSHRDGGIEGYYVSFYALHSPCPLHVDVGWFPSRVVESSAKVIASQTLYPFLGRRSENHYPLANFDSGSGGERDVLASGSQFLVSHHYRVTFCHCALSLDIYEGTAVGATLHELRLPFSHTSQYHSRCTDSQRFVEIERAFADKHRATVSLLVCLQSRHVVDGALQTEAGIGIIGLTIHEHGIPHVGNTAHRGMVATSGVVHWDEYAFLLPSRRGTQRSAQNSGGQDGPRYFHHRIWNFVVVISLSDLCGGSMLPP